MILGFFDSVLQTFKRISTADPLPVIFDGPAGNAASVALVTLAASGVSGNSADQVNINKDGVLLVVDITALGGTVPTLTVIVEAKDAASGKYVALLTSAALAAVATTKLVVYPGVAAAANLSASDCLPRDWRVRYVIGGTTPTVTATIGAALVL